VPRPAPAPTEPPQYRDTVQVHAEPSTAARMSHPATPFSAKSVASVYASSRADTFRAGARMHCPEQRPRYAPKQMMRALAKLLAISCQVSSVSCSSTAAAPPPYSLIHVNDAIEQPDAADWAAAYDASIGRNFILNAWTAYEPPEEVQLVQPIWDFKAKTKAHGTLDKRFVRCAARGDLMKPGVHYDPTRTAMKTPSHTALRLFHATAELNCDIVESYDVPGA
jgi:hypothetical protein